MKSLAVKYRPQTLSEVIGQDTITKILTKVLEKQTFKNAYLFAGPSGDGKTTIARAYAKAINGAEYEPEELDAASNGNIDQIRSIVDAANQRSLTGTYKIYIIDECHAISTAGWQVFLKCLEECPDYTIFIFCTTEPNKIPATVQNRM
jgi:DNA polymerase-3 subunit gamma/tau